jgi:glycosyltransferase involved in cell wall biosynthesis
MSQSIATHKYIIISPVKDEQEHLESTIHSVLNQTAKPAQWIIVDDGSQDETPNILDKYRKKHDWITVVRLNRKTERQPGSAVIHAFNQGCELIREDNFDFIVKLDCDLSFGSDYFEKLFLRFKDDADLGIASGVYLEKRKKGLMSVEMPDYHTAGASKVVRAECFREIGGFIAEKGWDTVDEIKAQSRGWKTGHFKEIIFYHLKNEGSGIGNIRTNKMHGEIYYLTGGSKLFFLIKFAHRLIFGVPFFLGGIMMLIGYLSCLIEGKHLLVNDREADFYKKLLNKRIISKFINA